MKSNTVYLIHFEKPVGKTQTAEQRQANGLPERKNGYKSHAQHYLGSTINLQQRIRQHHKGWGGKLMAYVVSLGIRWRVCRTWEFETETEARQFECRAKRAHANNLLCPVCNESAMNRYPVGETKVRNFTWQ